ncbi:MAG: hydroxymethylbilane synthase [Phycisphaeraceae bacterium]|nr:hydroxymethylbilane synthase [Phycisphaeraceae bacterium]
MRRSRRPIVIASRKSLLARTQAEQVGRLLSQLHPQLSVEFCWVESEGDQNPQAPLAANTSGVKGLFTRAVAKAVLEGRADLAVHSMKDMPADSAGGFEPAVKRGRGRPRSLPPAEGVAGAGLIIAAVPARVDPRDCLVGPGVTSLDDLPPSAAVGTSSPRRAAQLLRSRPDLKIELIRGNIDTRLRKVMQDRQHAATLLAAAGMLRAGFAEHAASPLDPSMILPAAGQGALAVQCRSDDHTTLARCLPLNDPISAAAVHAERAVLRALGGDCHSAIAVLVEPIRWTTSPSSRSGAGWRLRSRVISHDGQRMAEVDLSGPDKALDRLVREAVDALLAQGAKDILAQSTASAAAPAPSLAPRQ